MQVPTLYIERMDFDLPLYAVQCLANGRWLVRNHTAKA